MKKGKVMKVKDDFALILNENLNYEKIKSKKNLQVGKTIYYFEHDLYQEKKKNNVLQKVLLMASILFVVALINPTLLSVEESYGYISVDINPSVQMQVNAKDQVMDFVALNPEAEEIIDEDWIGLNYQDVISFIINKSEDQGYLNEINNFVFISYYAKDNERTIEEKIQAAFTNRYENVEIAITKAEKEDLTIAQNDQRSLGHVVYHKKVEEKNKNFEKLQEKFQQDSENNGIGNSQENAQLTQETNGIGHDNAPEEKIEQKTEEKINKTQEQLNQKVEKFEPRTEDNQNSNENKANAQVEKFEQKTEEKIVKIEQKAEEKIDKEVLKEMSKNDKEIKFIPNKKSTPGQGKPSTNNNANTKEKNNGNKGGNNGKGSK